MYWLEELMYQVSGMLLLPVLVLIVALFVYSLFALGMFSAEYWQRRRHRQAFTQAVQLAAPTDAPARLPGFLLYNHWRGHADTTAEHLELLALKHLERLRIVTRIAPMLGLVATMIPMGPALKSLADGNVQGISENLTIAFAAVIFGLVTASLTFWLASVKKRWLAVELHHLNQRVAESA